MWQLLHPIIRTVLGDCISVITMHLILVIFALYPCTPVICVFSPSITNTTYIFKERSGQEGQPKGEKKDKNPKANLTWLGAVTLSSWKEGGRQSVGDRIESATFATSARDSYWFYNYWNWKASRSLLFLTSSIPFPSHHPPPTQAATISRFTFPEPRGWGGNRRVGCSLLQAGSGERWAASHGTWNQPACSVDLIWSLEVRALKAYQ